MKLAICLLAASAAVHAQQYMISTYAGGPLATAPVTAVNAAIGSPQGIATDAAGNVYFTSLNASSPAYYHGRYGVFKLDRNGVLTRIAGNTGEGYSGDGGPALDAQFRLSNFDDEPGFPGVAVDPTGSVYIADSGNNRVRSVNPLGIIGTVAGNGISGSIDGWPATSKQLAYPAGLALDSAGNLYIAAGGFVRKVDSDGTMTTVAAAAAGSAIAAEWPGNLYIAGGGSVTKVSPDGVVTTLANEDGLAITVDRAHNLYLAEGGRVRKITPDGVVTTVAGTGTCGDSGDGGPAIRAQVCANGVAVDIQGNLYLADASAQRIRKVDSAGIISTVAGNGSCCYSGDGGPASSATLNLAPWGGGIALDAPGNLYIADTSNQSVRKVSPSGVITTVAGNDVSNGYSGDGGLATSAQLNYPSGVAVDSSGNLYIADFGNQAIRKVSSSGIISTVAQSSGRALTIDNADNLYFVDAVGVRKLSAASVLTTVTTAQFNLPFAIAVDNAGNLYVAEAGSPAYRVRKITPAGAITTVAGNGTVGDSGDGGPAINAQLNGPAGLAVDSAGNLFIADSFNARIRMVSPSGMITTVAGNGGSGYTAGRGPALSAPLGSMTGLAIDSAGDLYAADQYYNAIHLLQPSGPVIVSSILNAASYLGGAIAPGELVVVNGYGLGPAQLVSSSPGSDGVYAAQLAGTSVLVNNVPATLIYTSASQVVAMVPNSVSVGPAQVTVTYQGQTSVSFPIPVAPAAPGIFTADLTGRGLAATVDQNGAKNTAAAWGDLMTLFVTGVENATPAVVTIWPDDPASSIMIPISILPGTVPGVMQIQIPIHYGWDCDQPVRVQVGGASSQEGVSISMGICI